MNMMSPNELYKVLSAVVPLYFAMFLAYSSTKHFGVFTAEQCAGVNRFVAVFAVPLLSLNFVSRIDPFRLHFLFLAADALSKLLVLLLLLSWSHLFKNGNLDWSITFFSMATLPNTLVMGIPLLKSMYGDGEEELMIQLVVMQSIVWYTLLLFLFEFRRARRSLVEEMSGHSVKEEVGVIEEEVVHVVVVNSTGENDVQRPQFMTKVAPELDEEEKVDDEKKDEDGGIKIFDFVFDLCVYEVDFKCLI